VRKASTVMSGRDQSRRVPVIRRQLSSGRRRRAGAIAIHRTGKSEIYDKRRVVATRYPYERAWSVATYLLPITVRSRAACIAAPLDAQDMPNRASTDDVVRNLPLVA
jgi:hypothetical protein